MRQRLFWNRDSRSWEPIPPRSAQRVHIIPDEHEAFKSHADGKMYTSKSRYRAELRAHGCEEMGNERVSNPAPSPMGDCSGDFRRAASERGLL